VWFDFDPTEFAAFARHQSHEYRGLSERLAESRRAAWKCDTYLALSDDEDGGHGGTAMIDTEGEDYAIDLDRDGKVRGIEFLSRLPCRSD
jgi:hypothetical protein